MRLKPKSTVHNPRAVLYKRFTDLETATEKRVCYVYYKDGMYITSYVFDTENYKFIPAPFYDTQYEKRVPIDEYAFYRYGDFVFRFTATREKFGDDWSTIYVWERIKLSDIGENGEHEVELTVNVGGIGAGTYQRFFKSINIKNILTKPVDEITIYQKTGYQFDECYCILNLGDKSYHFGGSAAIPPSGDYVVPDDTNTDFSLRATADNNGLVTPYTMDIGGIISPSDDVDIVVSVKFMATGLDLLSALFNDVARYQTNKYYRVGTFDYMIRGSIEGSENQIIKGAIAPLNSMEIKHFNDHIKLDHDDLVVIDGHLYYVEDTTRDEKRMPKKYNVYFARLNNIL